METNLRLRHHRSFSHAAIEADAQSDDAGEHEEVAIKGAEDSKEKDDFGNKISQQQGIVSAILRRAEFVILVQCANGGDHEPEEAKYPKNTQRQNHRQR